MNRFVSTIAIAAVALGTTAAFAQVPPANVGARHMNIQAAQHLIDQANQRIVEAQQDNHGQLGGHAEKARQLLVQASDELKQAADYANSRK